MTVAVDLCGKTAVVTGASSGIGMAIARCLGECGARVWLAGRTSGPMEATKAIIEAAGGKAEVVVFDIRDLNALVALVDRAAEDTGRLDIVVNNAGLCYRASVLDGERDHWREMIEVNVLALLVCTQAAVRAMRRHGSEGHIVSISSTDAFDRDGGVYGATKAAVDYLTEALRQELEDDIIRISTVSPGPVATNIVRNFEKQVIQDIHEIAGIDVEPRPGEHLPPEALERVQQALEQLIAKPGDIAEAVLYIVSQPARLNIAGLVVRPAKALVL
jgi:NADP-dependent 3-hydroxy acid dehydrogenase YdfG